MRDITLVIPAWHRPWYLQECLASWSRVRGIDGLLGVTLRLARSDSGMEQAVRAVAETAAWSYGFPMQVVRDDPEDGTHKGPDRALGMQFRSSFADPRCEFVIECDEDVVVSDDALEYVAWARKLDQVCVCLHNDVGSGWNPPGGGDVEADQAAVRVRGEFTSYCFGFSRAAWEQVWEPSWDWDRSSGSDPDEHGWEWQMHRQANAGLRLAIPDASRCQNIGRDGGTFSLPHHFEASQARSFRAHRRCTCYYVAGQ